MKASPGKVHPSVCLAGHMAPHEFRLVTNATLYENVWVASDYRLFLVTRPGGTHHSSRVVFGRYAPLSIPLRHHLAVWTGSERRLRLRSARAYIEHSLRAGSWAGYRV